MLTLINSSELNLSVLHGRFTVSKLNGEITSCIGASSTNKVFIRHSGHNEDQIVQYLNIDQEITALGHLEQHPSAVIVGTSSHLISYDTLDNKILINKEIENGVCCLLVGVLGDSDQEVIIIGGNCFLQTLKADDGEELFWNVMSDEVTSLALIDYDADGHHQVLAGTEDGYLRIFKNDRLLTELKETDGVCAVAALSNQCFGYALADGTVGVYHKRTPLWKLKLKNKAAALTSYDADNDGAADLICTFGGRFEARHWQTGDIIFKSEKARQEIAAITSADWLNSGCHQLVVCSRTGNMRCYAPNELEVSSQLRDEAEEETIRRLLIRKQDLMIQLEQLESAGSSELIMEPEIDPATVKLVYDDDCLKLVVEMGGSLIHAVVIFAQGVLANGESHACHLFPARTSCHVALPLVRHLAVDLRISILVSWPQWQEDQVEDQHDLLHVVDVVAPLPTFALIRWVVPQSSPHVLKSNYQVKVRLQERIQRIVLWLKQNFIVPEELKVEEAVSSASPLDLCGVVLPTNAFVAFFYSAEGLLVLKSQRLDVIADIIQHLAAFLNIHQLGSEIEIDSAELEEILAILKNIRQLQSVRQRLTIDTAQQINAVRNLHAELGNAKMLGNKAEMRQKYVAIHTGNQQLLDNNQIRNANYQSLMNALKRVNLHVQHSAKCRVGKHQADVIQASRNAIKRSDFDQLIKITLYGIDQWDNK